MMSAKNIGLRLAVLVVLQGLCLETSHSETPDVARIREEISKQDAIYQRTRSGAYKVDRSLEDYAYALPADFDRSLAKLGPEDRWLDVGAGEGQAILDYYAPAYDRTRPEARKRRGKKARAVAMSIEDRRTPDWHQSAKRLGPDRIRYLAGKRLREYSTQELGRFQIITDVVGGFTYTENLSLFVEKVLDLLELKGSFYTLLQDVRSEDGTNKPYRAGLPYLTEIAQADGAKVAVCSWLKSISCVNVTCELKDGWQPPIETFHVHKVCNAITVPPLATVHYEAGTPPERRFRLGDRMVNRDSSGIDR